MKRVLKYPVPLEDTFTLKLPRGAEILHVAEQAVGNVYLWALVGEDKGEDNRTFRLAGTGHEIYEDVAGQFIGTFFALHGQLVFHLFETTGKA